MTTRTQTTAATTTNDDELAMNIAELKTQYAAIGAALAVVEGRYERGVLTPEECDQVATLLHLGFPIVHNPGRAFCPPRAPKHVQANPAASLGWGLVVMESHGHDVDKLGGAAREGDDEALSTFKFARLLYEVLAKTLRNAEELWVAKIAEAEKALALASMSEEERAAAEKAEADRLAEEARLAKEEAEKAEAARLAQSRRDRLLNGLLHVKTTTVVAADKPAPKAVTVQAVRAPMGSVDRLNKALDKNVREWLNGRRLASLERAEQTSVVKNATYVACRWSLIELTDITDDQRIGCMADLIADAEISSRKPEVETMSEQAIRQLAKEILADAKEDLKAEADANAAPVERKQRPENEAVQIALNSNLNWLVANLGKRTLESQILRVIGWGHSLGFDEAEILKGVIAGLQSKQEHFPCSEEQAKAKAEAMMAEFKRVMAENERRALENKNAPAKPQRPQHAQNQGRATHPNPGNGEASAADIAEAKKSGAVKIAAPPKGLDALRKVKAALDATDTPAN